MRRPRCDRFRQRVRMLGVFCFGNCIHTMNVNVHSQKSLYYSTNQTVHHTRYVVVFVPATCRSSLVVEVSRLAFCSRSLMSRQRCSAWHVVEEPLPWWQKTIRSVIQSRGGGKITDCYFKTYCTSQLKRVRRNTVSGKGNHICALSFTCGWSSLTSG